MFYLHSHVICNIRLHLDHFQVVCFELLRQNSSQLSQFHKYLRGGSLSNSHCKRCDAGGLMQLSNYILEKQIDVTEVIGAFLRIR
jgi:hypothetical protein